MECSTMIWLLAAALAQSAIAMSVYLISHMADPQPPQPYSLADILSGNVQMARLRMKRSSGFGGFKNFDTDSWFPWRKGHHGSASDFHDFDGGFKGAPHHHFGGHGKSGGCCKGRAEPSLGEKFTTNLKEVPDETRNQFYKPEQTSTAARREKYGLNRAFSTPPHAYDIAKEIPFFDTLDHKSVMLTLVTFRDDNKIPVLKLESIRPHFPFFYKD